MLTRSYPCVIPYDPVMMNPFINAIGSNETEAKANLDLIDLPDDLASRLVFKRAEVTILIKEASNEQSS